MENLSLNIEALDLKKAQEGTWIDYDKDISFLIARANTPAYRGAVKRMHKQYRRKIEAETMSDELSDELTGKLMAEHILLDWKGLKNAGEEFKYSKANALALLTSAKYAELRDWILNQAHDEANYREEQLKKQKKSS